MNSSSPSHDGAVPPNTLYDPSGNEIGSEVTAEDGRLEDDGSGPRQPERSELELDAKQGAVFVKLPSGKVMGFPPDQAKSLGGTLLNLAREAKAQQSRTDPPSPSA